MYAIWKALCKAGLYKEYRYSILYWVHILYFLYFFQYNHTALGNQQEITVKVYLKMVSAALELTFFLFDLTEFSWVVIKQLTEWVACVDSLSCNSLLIFRISVAIRRKELKFSTSHCCNLTNSACLKSQTCCACCLTVLLMKWCVLLVELLYLECS